MNRRDFIKAGAITAAGIAGTVVFGGMNSLGAQTVANAQRSGKPIPAKHWGMVIDISKFQTAEDIERVAQACHHYHNVPEMKDPNHEIKWIWSEDFQHSFAEMESDYFSEKIKKLNFPIACNHCESPACVRVCPTKATFKRPDGIVAMDYHRCIGCRYCMAACPFNARSFNFFDPKPMVKEISPDYPCRTIGVVEKCTLCSERIDKGLQPVCVEASNGAIVFGDLDDPNSEVRQILSKNFAIRRKVELGTGPNIYYVLRGGGEGA